jgi:AraC family transcriptional regulator, regulatory protein of adaptative response / methylated-DNA-[protein]-cysteine methyltransferase
VGEIAFRRHLSLVTDYERIAGIIEYLDAHYTEQPDLASLAGQIGLSPFHFHRLFTAWAGVTPKDFVQCLTLNHAKELLRKGASVLDSALEAGLSGPGRLHDLCITFEAVSPGELKSRGANSEIRYGIGPSPFGDWLVAENARGVCQISFVDKETASTVIEELHKQWSEAHIKRDDAVAARLADSVFHPAPPGTNRNLRGIVRGTPFQVRVWRALLQIPTGTLVSYGKLAEQCGHPNAARAVGSAVGQNPLAFLIPCHRVIRETGIVGDYRWGRTRKRAIIGWEALQMQGA